MAYIRLVIQNSLKHLQGLFGSRLNLVCRYAPNHQKNITDSNSLSVWEVPYDVKQTRILIRQLGTSEKRCYHVFSEKSLGVFFAQRVMSGQGCSKNTDRFANVRAEPGYEKIVLSALYDALLLWQEKILKEYRAMARYVLLPPGRPPIPVLPLLFEGRFFRLRFPTHTIAKRNGKGSFTVSSYKAPPRPDLAIPHEDKIEVPFVNALLSTDTLDQRMLYVRDYFRHKAHPTVSEMYIIHRGSYNLRYLYYTAASQKLGFKWMTRVMPNIRGFTNGVDKRRSNKKKYHTPRNPS